MGLALDSVFDFITNNWGKLTAIITTVSGFMIGRKSKKNKDDLGQLNNIKLAREIERSLLDDMEEQITKLIQTNNTLEAIIKEQSNVIREYQLQFGSLKK